MIRVGLGYDIHRLSPDRALVLGGVRIPFHLGLVGHSDADVVVHGLMDALLGAAALGDIGRHFPPTDDRFRGASSLELLRVVASLLREKHISVLNVDMVVVAEEPSIGPYLERMRESIAEALAIGRDEVSIKATTNEGVGPEGRGEAISAHAVALVETSQDG